MPSIKLFETRPKKEGSELATKCSQLKMQSAGGIETVTTCHGLKSRKYQINHLPRHSRVGGNPVPAFAMSAQFNLDTRLRGYDGTFDISPPVMTTATHTAMSAQNLTASDEMSGKMSEKVSEKIFIALKDDPQSTIAELAAKVGATTRTVERNLKKLQQESRVARIGPDNGGYWKVISPP